MRTIEVVVRPNGETQVETKGFAGAGCREGSEFLEQALGVAAKEKRTAEFYHVEPREQLNVVEGTVGGVGPRVLHGFVDRKP